MSAADGEAAENTERVLQALRTLRQGPWWPPLDELLDRARHFFAGSLGGGNPATAARDSGPGTAAGTPAAAQPRHRARLTSE